MNKSKDSIKNPYTLSKLILAKVAELGVAVVDGFFPKKYPEAQLWRKLAGLDSDYNFSRQNFSKLLSKLQSQGLVHRTGSKKKSYWEITSKGKAAVQSLHAQDILFSGDGIRRIVTFDISEKERKKRYWIRSRLIEHGYEQLQKSVWLGNIPLQKDFFSDLEDFKLVDSVHIFSIREEGTLKKNL